MTRIESELHDLYECLMRNDDMADRDTYHTIVGIANDVAEVEDKNAKLRELARDLRFCARQSNCLKCEHGRFCDLRLDERCKELGIEVKE